MANSIAILCPECVKIKSFSLIRLTLSVLAKIKVECIFNFCLFLLLIIASCLLIREFKVKETS